MRPRSAGGFSSCVPNELLRTNSASGMCFAQRRATPTGNTRPGRAYRCAVNGFAACWLQASCLVTVYASPGSGVVTPLASLASRRYFLNGPRLGPPRVSSGSLQSTPFCYTPGGNLRSLSGRHWWRPGSSMGSQSVSDSVPRTRTRCPQGDAENTGRTRASSSAVRTKLSEWIRLVMVNRIQTVLGLEFRDVGRA